ncbi:MAG: DUF1957 domain-containing protein [Planctomycetota bacterium]|jgi:1,4-alpha-glucan branching enzyme|nr:DUF1957 domain-containing protein [Planctomycetota bacterium]
MADDLEYDRGGGKAGADEDLVSRADGGSSGGDTPLDEGADTILKASVSGHPASQTETDGKKEVIRSGGRVSANTGVQKAAKDEDDLKPGDAIPGEEGVRVKVDLDLLKEVPYLDPLYNETYLYLIPRDPESMFAVWEVSDETRASLVEKFGADFFKKNRLILRIYRVTGIEFSGFNAHSVFEVDDWLNDKNEYWIKVKPDNDYVAEIGYRADGTDFFEIVARSNSAFAPKDSVTNQQKYADWADVEVDPNDVILDVGQSEWRINQYNYWKNRTHCAPDEKGYWSLVLHQHLPFVHHPEYDVPLEEQWFMEAVISVYTRLLDLFWRLERDKVDFRVTLSLTPSLLSMMQTPLLQKRAARHIDECIAFATRERDNSKGKPWYNTIEQTLHRFWVAKTVFDAYEGDLTRGYRDFQDMGKIEVITCAATHMILPLFKHISAAANAQLDTGVKQYERVFGRPPRGMWLPENAFTPGVDKFLADSGIKWALLSAVGIDQGDTKSFFGTDAPVVSPAGVTFFGIDEETRSSVWSREGGYPGHPNYKEWYRDLGYEAEWDYLPEYFRTANVRRNTGIKYYRITKKGGSLGDKDYYNPMWAEGTVHEQAGQFAYYRGVKANHVLKTTNRKSLVVSAYDAELFGHWWEEGPLWIESVFRKMLFDQTEVRPVTPSEYLGEHKRHQRMMPGASSWGRNDYFQTWVDGRSYQPNCWVYRHMYRLSQQVRKLAVKHKNTENPILIRALNQAVRELFLAISSDWGFLVETGQAVRYSELRITVHTARTRQLLRQIENDRIDLTYLCTLETADCIFAFDDMDFRRMADD